MYKRRIDFLIPDPPVDDFMLPECETCDTDPCDKDTMDKCKYWLKWIEEANELAEMEAHIPDDYEGYYDKWGGVNDKTS